MGIHTYVIWKYEIFIVELIEVGGKTKLEELGEFLDEGGGGVHILEDLLYAFDGRYKRYFGKQADHIGG